jgi:ketosteroid isomerase-like protein
MKNFFVISMICLQSILAHAFADDTEATKEITALIQAYNQAISEGNGDALSKFWTDDAELMAPITGEVIDGKEEILKFLSQRMAELKERNLQYSFKLDKIDFPEKDKSFVEGITEVNGKKGLFFRAARKVELLKQNGQWYIDSVSDIEIPPAPPIHNKLKDMDWIIGTWKDQDDNVAITFSNSWDKFRNFILSRFTMAIYDVVAMEGMQIIGWDPIKQSLQSWVFDSDGGNGTGTWSKKGDGWEVAFNYTLSDGKKASATNIYTKVDNDHYRFASINRKVDGKALPDIDPVTVKREE